MLSTCPAGLHPHRGSQDNYGNGACKECRKEYARRYRAATRDALKRLRELEGNTRD